MRKLSMLLMGTLIILSNAFANFGGELVNPRTVPHRLQKNGVGIEIPANWSVEQDASSIAASNLALADASLRPSRIRLSADSQPAAFKNAQCSSTNISEGTKTICMLSPTKGQATLIKNGNLAATLDFEQGTHAQANTELKVILQSLGNTR